jgi:diguanylate cyclase (GGDEF)-like protein
MLHELTVDLHLSKAPRTVPILLLEDDPDYAALVRVMLEEAKDTEFEVRHVQRLEDARGALQDFAPACILADLTLPDARWLEAPTALREVAPNVPIVILSGLDDESLAMRAVHEGAQDYLVKGHANAHSLGRAIRYAIERMQAEAESAKKAMYDSLTGLPNRNLFVKRLEQARVRHAGQLASVVVLSVHLENLELINDSLGRPAGRQLLQAVSIRLRAALPELGVVACFGSSLFGFLCENVSSGPYRHRLVARVRKSFEVPFVFETGTVFVTARVGVAIDSLNGGADPEALIQRAEAAADEAEQHVSEELAHSYSGHSTGVG